MEAFPDTCLAHSTKENKKIRDLISTMVKAYWKALNEWTSASNSGLQSLKTVVKTLVNINSDQDLPWKVHPQCLELNSHINTMKRAVKTLDDLKEELKKVMNLQEIERPGCTFEPLYSTITPNRFYDVFSHLTQACMKETEIKVNICKPLACTRDTDILNTCITLWARSPNFLQPHLYHIKILLREAELL